MNLQTTIDFGLKDFLQWWSKELAFLIPQKLKQTLSDRTGELIFQAGEQGFNVSFYNDPLNEAVFTRQLENIDPAAYQALKTQYPDIEKADYILRLNDGQAINKILYLPAAVQENLMQVVGFELDRYTPFKADQVYFSVTPMGKTEQGQLQVMLIATPQSILDDQLAQLNVWGVQPGRVEYRPLNDTFPQLTGQYNLLPERYLPRTGKWAQSIHWLLNGLLLILLLAVMIYPVWQEKQAVDLLKTNLKGLEKETRIVDEQQVEIDAVKDETQRLIDIKIQSPEMVSVLYELTHLLKNDTWLTHLQYTETHMQIQGQSPSASALIGLLEASPLFSKVSFVSPLTQDKATGLERFQISMDVSAKPPEPVQAADAEPTDAEATDAEQVDPEQSPEAVDTPDADTPVESTNNE